MTKAKWSAGPTRQQQRKDKREKNGLHKNINDLDTAAWRSIFCNYYTEFGCGRIKAMVKHQEREKTALILDKREKEQFCAHTHTIKKCREVEVKRSIKIQCNCNRR